MRVDGMMGLAAGLLLMAGCGASEPRDDALADFVPPTLVKRDEVRARLVQRFDARDADHDRRLSDGELGPAADRLAAADTNKDGAIQREEFVARGLARFDRADTDRDGMVSNVERDAARAKRTTAAP